jgi:hypothetical protein
VTTSCLIELHYLPSIAYFACLSKFDTIILEKHEHYVKQSYRNRCHIVTANGIERLSIPLTSKHGKVYITDIKIDYAQKWLSTHWRAIQSAYRNAPFFEYYADELHHTLFKCPPFLYDLNFELLTICLKWLKLSPTIKESLSYDKHPDNQVTDCRNLVHAKKTSSLSAFFTPISYPQVFGSKFAENVSIIDLVFCEGPHARWVVDAAKGQ